MPPPTPPRDDTKTLQSVLELGLYRAGLINERNFGHPNKYGWSNSARTDKGVHAAAQVCSFKGEMILFDRVYRGNDDDDDDDDDDDVGESSSMRNGRRLLSYREQFDMMREKVNDCLPMDVRVLDIERVTKSFCARTNRDKVRYQYMVPSYLLLSREEVRRALFHPLPTGGGDAAGDVDARISRSRRDLVRYRVSSERMELLKAGLKLFEGTHNFHNYTRRVGSDDATSNRFILSFVPLDPVIVKSGSTSSSTEDDDDEDDDDNTQWIPLQVVGQSFLLNQIRKMVSAAIDHARGAVTRETIVNSLTGQSKMKVDVAPPNGLFLDRSYFELYNRHKVKNAPRHGDNGEQHNTLDWVEAGEGEEVPPAVRRIEEFKNERIIPHIVREEVREGNFMHYMYSHESHFDEMYSSMGEREPKV
ncbi:hypothetical protein ACHAXA_005139 [Cyclostephanos tholiformis]|uniref:tRNA pseudouridine synthase n=1 Tax=Cyclostephanos tholiformis TaxID=382380 RepID=A0ABD3RXF6_9STRA